MRIKALLLLPALIAAFPSLARDFEYTYEGQTLTYTVIDEAAKTAMTKEGSYSNGTTTSGNNVTGKLIIPEKVKDGDVEFTVTKIGDYAFNGCSGLTEVIISNAVTSIGRFAFQDCSSMKEVAIGNSVTLIDNSAFRNCSDLTSVTIPNSVTEIVRSAFRGCSGLTEMSIPNSVTSIGEYAFEECSGLTQVTIPNTIVKINDGVFSACHALTSVTIPNSVTEIGARAFIACIGLTQVTIPESVTEIGLLAFCSCSSLTSIYAYPTVPPTLGEDVFKGVTRTIPVYVPDGSVDAYRNAEGWDYFTAFQNENGIEAISAEADGDAEYFTLQGIRVKSDKLAPGVYIRRSGNRTDKVLVK